VPVHRSGRSKKGGLRQWWRCTKAWLYPKVLKKKHSAIGDKDKSSTLSLAAPETPHIKQDSLSSVDLKGEMDPVHIVACKSQVQLLWVAVQSAPLCFACSVATQVQCTEGA